MKKISAFLKQCLQIAIASVKGFQHDDCYAKASALTFYSLLSIVPVFAIAFGIAAGFGFQTNLERNLLEKFPEHEVIVYKLISFTYSLLEHTKSQLIAGVGILLLFWTVIKLLENIENALNSIWKVTCARSFTRKLSDYLTIILLCPLLFVVSSSVTVFLTTYLSATFENLYLETISNFLLLVLHLLPLVLSWAIFSLIYLFMPNAKVSLRFAIIAGIVAGTAYQTLQAIYLQFQIGVSSYNAIYGSFAAFPLFLIWLQLSWILVLLGAEIAYHARNLSTEFASVLKNLDLPRTQVSKKLIGIWIVYRCIQVFRKEREPTQAEQLAEEGGIAFETVENLLDELIEEKILCKAVFNGTEYYLPAYAPEKITIKEVSDALDRSHKEKVAASPIPEITNLQQQLQVREEAMENSPDNLSLEAFAQSISQPEA